MNGLGLNLIVNKARTSTTATPANDHIRPVNNPFIYSLSSYDFLSNSLMITLSTCSVSVPTSTTSPFSIKNIYFFSYVTKPVDACQVLLNVNHMGIHCKQLMITRGFCLCSCMETSMHGALFDSFISLFEALYMRYVHSQFRQIQNTWFLIFSPLCTELLSSYVQQVAYIFEEQRGMFRTFSSTISSSSWAGRVIFTTRRARLGATSLISNIQD